MKLPTKLYVRVGHERDGSPYYVANPKMVNVFDEDGPFTIGVYTLVETVRAEKTVTVAKGKKKTAR